MKWFHADRCPGSGAIKRLVLEGEGVELSQGTSVLQVDPQILRAEN